jgi:HSP20 family protein
MLTRWDPFGEIDRLFGGRTTESQVFTPAVDIYEEDEAIVLKAELPGLKAEDVQIDLDNNVLTVRGEHKREDKEQHQGYQRIERRYGSFVRSFVVPGTASVDKIEAHMADGVLEVRIPKRPEKQPKRIQVRTVGELQQGSPTVAVGQQMPQQAEGKQPEFKQGGGGGGPQRQPNARQLPHVRWEPREHGAALAAPGGPVTPATAPR